jgi:hypothetical protein
MTEEETYNNAMDLLCATIREAIFTARNAGISVQAMWEEAENALANALNDAENELIAG